MTEPTVIHHTFARDTTLSLIVDPGSHTFRAGLNAYYSPRTLRHPCIENYVTENFDPSTTTNSIEAPCNESTWHRKMEPDTLAQFIHTTSEKHRYLSQEAFTPTESCNFTPPLVVVAPREYDRNQCESLLQSLLTCNNIYTVALVSSASAQCFSVGRATGVVLEGGNTTTSCVAVHEGYTLRRTESDIPLGGLDITLALQRLLCPRQPISPEDGIDPFSRYSLLMKDALLTKVKHQCLEVFDKTPLFPLSRHFLRKKSECVLPDGCRIQLGLERFGLTEPLFQPLDLSSPDSCTFFGKLTHWHPNALQEENQHSLSVPRSVQDLVVHTLSQVSPLTRDALASTVLTCGGGLHYIKNFSHRLQHELEPLLLSQNKKPTSHMRAHPTFLSSQHGSHSAWCGASIVSQINSFAPMYINQAQLDEHGVTRCLALKMI